MCTWCQLFCALCRIGCYKCCRKSDVSRPEYTVIAVGLTQAGKSTLLATLGNEDTSDIQPTQGFSIKALQFPGAILNVKELGGNVEQYWAHYFQGVQGIVFVVDSSDSRHLEEASYCLVKVLSSPFLKGLPLLILANKQDVENAKDLEEIKNILNLHVVAQNFNWTIHGCTSQDRGSIEMGFTMLIDKLEPDLPTENNRI